MTGSLGIFTTIRGAGEAIAIAAIDDALIDFTVASLTVRSTEQAVRLPDAAAALASGMCILTLRAPAADKAT
ncbi:hypothetical protein V5F32_12475 [Xanthobacter oligotrophicus]|uniref:Uncharacterized protein n=1 Tax=Xanthobacter oligotrophicus TaxID=2607286 RepID=A0ABW6ZWZ9_9HYPH